jgi:hypothetical protein
MTEETETPDPKALNALNLIITESGFDLGSV